MTSDERHDVLLVIRNRLSANMAEFEGTQYESEQALWRERMDECDILLREMEKELPTPVEVDRARARTELGELAIQAVIKLTDATNNALGDYCYDIRERELLGWDGPRVTLWSQGSTLAKQVYDESTKQAVQQATEDGNAPEECQS